MKKRSLIFIVPTVLIMLLTACSAVQVNERMFVQLMGIGENSGLYELTLQVYSPKGAEGDDSAVQYEVIRGSGWSFYEAAENIMLESGRELFFGHCGAIFADDGIIRDSEKLKALAGERISIGCPVIYSEKPSEEVDRRDDKGELMGADVIIARTKRCAEEGLYMERTIKDVASAAKNGSVILMPMSDNGISGIAAVDMSGGTSLLSISETAAVNFIRGGKGIKMTLLGGCAEISLRDMSVYFRQEEKGGELTVAIEADMTVDELGIANDLSLYAETAENIISGSVEAVCERALKEGFIMALPVGDIPDNGDIAVTVNAKVNI